MQTRRNGCLALVAVGGGGGLCVCVCVCVGGAAGNPKEIRNGCKEVKMEGRGGGYAESEQSGAGAKGWGRVGGGLRCDAMCKYAARSGRELRNTSIWTMRLGGKWKGKEQTNGGNGDAGNSRKWKETERNSRGKNA